jgi:hypothetical protein
MSDYKEAPERPEPDIKESGLPAAEAKILTTFRELTDCDREYIQRIATALAKTKG